MDTVLLFKKIWDVVPDFFIQYFKSANVAPTMPVDLKEAVISRL